MSAPLPRAPDVSTLSPLLEGLSVLIAEDSSLIALDTESIARELGAAEVSAHPSSATALAALSTRSFDIAILDFNLGSETSTAIADALYARGIPFIFVTGYSDAASIPQRFAGTPVIRKPVDATAMYQVLAGVLLK
jgi:CheY-like chemotaxis protein